MVEGAVAQGMTTTSLAGTGIHPPDLADENAQIWAHQEFAVIRNLLAGLGDLPGPASAALLAEEWRPGRALELLGQGAAVSEVARELGYSETSTFTKSFTRWERVSPSRARERGL